MYRAMLAKLNSPIDALMEQKYTGFAVNSPSMEKVARYVALQCRCANDHTG